MKTPISHAAIGLILAGISSGAGAQDAVQVPDLKGRWSGTSEVIVSGTLQHHDGGSAFPTHRLTATHFTIAVEGQDGRRFWGKLSSQRHTSPIIGVIAHDGRTIQMQGERGTTEGRLIDANSLEVVYGHSTPTSLVSSTALMKRER